MMKYCLSMAAVCLAVVCLGESCHDIPDGLACSLVIAMFTLADQIIEEEGPSNSRGQGQDI